MIIDYAIPYIIALAVCLMLGYFVYDSLKPNRRSIAKAVICSIILIAYIALVIFCTVQTIR